MALTALEIKDKTFKTKLRGYSEEEVNEFLDIVVDDYEALVRQNREQEARIRDLEEKLSYFDEMKESLSQSVILAQETAEKVKASANTEASNLVSKANYDAQLLLDESKSKANQILRDATDEAKRVAIDTEELKRKTRVFHQRLISAVESQLSLANSPEWSELLQPTAVYLQNSDSVFREVVEKVLDEEVPESSDSASFDATRQFSPEEMEELQRRVEESNKQLEAEQAKHEESTSAEVEHSEINLNETQTFKLNIED
ncbi:DivIVA domain-containing protein [Streptococcus urinalis FB127-CNA-2]|uniref:DivIVA domain-containing protein n=1 Tax=Streptococcus urinalis TaxID=149016 RepID=UPI000225D142|nr:DivIVA domain-containing protein [Streptococcus urinalis]EKS19331.1 DivIVA domain-containing protein [Streptococcus urinalis FB127-CNA-2]